jgi:ABC-type lipoprotein export system ATPase subunit
VILSAEALAKRYGGAASGEAVRAASLELAAGEYVSIVGRSGSGKSTLLAMLGALTRPTEGVVRVDGTDLWALSENERAAFRGRHIGFVFQFPSLLPDLTAVDNIALPALLGRTMAPETVYDRAFELLEQVGLASRAGAFPAGLSGGEQRRVAIARALINAPPLLLADEPTSDLDADSEAEIIGLLEELRRNRGFGLVLVTHDMELAGRAQRHYEMRQGVLAEAAPPRALAAPLARQRLATAAAEVRSAAAAPIASVPPAALGADFRRNLKILLTGGAAVAAALVLADFGVAKYQEVAARERGERVARLAELALSALQSEIQSIADLGKGHYELTVTLWNAGGGGPLYVMSPDMRAYVQVGKLWQEVPLEPADDDPGGVTKIAGKRGWRYRFKARVSGFTQLLPNYMHVRFSDTMLVSPSEIAQDGVFERKDNYYVYLKPSDIADEAILSRMKFTGKPPVWIPMPPH